MSAKEENADIIAYLEAARTAIDRAQWEVVDVESRRSRDASLRNAHSQMTVATRAMGDAFALIEKAKATETEVAEHGRRSF